MNVEVGMRIAEIQIDQVQRGINFRHFRGFVSA